jgi:enoyl-CoA hydratase/carnithine racemase
MSGVLIGADEALDIGLVDSVFPSDELRDKALEIARTIASKSPIALQAAKESILAARRMPLDEGLKFERAWFGLLFSTEDKDEGVGAFLEKREPDFTGR